MRSLRADQRRAWRPGVWTLCAALLAALFAVGGEAAEPVPITDADVARALVKVAADPDMGQEHVTHTLKFNTKQTTPASGASLHWLENLVNWVASAGRVIFWVLVALLVSLLLVYLLRAARAQRPRDSHAELDATVTHVGTLDIRPESLPDDIGATALALWNEGQARSALSLLYRGALSRLVHRHAVQIHDSNTEAECAALANSQLVPERARYVSRLINCWVGAVYGERMPASDQVHELCATFASQLESTGQEWAGSAQV